MKRPRVVLADDYQPSHEVYGQVLAPEADVVAAVENGEAAIDAAQTYAPDLMVLDISMGAMNGFTVARWVKEHLPNIRIIFLTMHAESAYIDEAVDIGAEGYVLKRSGPGELLHALHSVLEGGKYYPPPGTRGRH